ncbi:unnamed protein product [Calypogeia fissa]
MGLATGATANPFNPATFNFSSRAEPDQQLRQEEHLQQHEQHDYSSFSNPMSATNGNAESEFEANQDTQHHEDTAQQNQHQHHQNPSGRVPTGNESSLSSRLGLSIPRQEIPRGDIPADQLPPWAQALRKSAEITKAKWGDKPKILISMDVQEAADYTQYLLDHTLIGYFTSQCPLLDEFYDWVQHEFSFLRGWKIFLVKFVGKNFYLIMFDNPLHRQQALSYHPWKYNNKFVYFFAYEPEFNVSTGQYTKLPVWVEITYRDLNLEPMRMKIAEALGPVLLYLQEDDHSVFPHDRVCILWDMNRPIPYCVEILIGSGIALYQPLVFKNMPFTCFKCNRHGHIARDCKMVESSDYPAGVGYPDQREVNLG